MGRFMFSWDHRESTVCAKVPSSSNPCGITFQACARRAASSMISSR